MSSQRKHVRRIAGDYYIVVDCQSEKILGRVMNMTVEGMMIVTNQTVEVGDTYTCRMALPEPISGSRKVTFKAECRWSEINQDSGWRKCGFRLFDMSDRDLKTLEQVLERWGIAGQGGESSDQAASDGSRPEIQVSRQPAQE